MNYQFEDVERFAQAMAKAPKVVEREMTASATRLALQGEGWTKPITPVATGTLRRSIAARAGTFGGGVARSSWGTATPYAKAVEEGRGAIAAGPGKALVFKPHPKYNIPVKTKGKYAGLAVFKRVKGTTGAFMFKKARQRLAPMVPREFRAAMRRVIAEVGG